MYRKKTIGVVVPAYNESKLIGETLSGIPSYVDKIYAVDDGSKDNTSDIIKSFRERDPRFILIEHEKNQGVGAALITGYNNAYKDGIDIIAVMAGDNQMDPEELYKLLDPIVDGKADYSKGNRLYSSDSRKGMSKWRSFGNNMLTLLTKIGSGYWHISDPQNGYTAISRQVFEKIKPDTIFPWYGYCNDMLAKLNVYGFRVVDVPIPARYGREKSTIKYSTYIPKVSWLLLRNFLWRLRMKYVIQGFYPWVLFYLIGGACVLLSLFSVVYVVTQPQLANSNITYLLILFFVGVFSLFFGVQSERVEDLKDSRSGSVFDA